MARRGTPFAGLLYIGLAMTAAARGSSSSTRASAIPRPRSCWPCSRRRSAGCCTPRRPATSAGQPPLRWRDRRRRDRGAGRRRLPGRAAHRRRASPAPTSPASSTRAPGAATTARSSPSGGRVLSVTATGATLAEARERRLRAAVGGVELPGGQYRTDIALRAVAGRDHGLTLEVCAAPTASLSGAGRVRRRRLGRRRDRRRGCSGPALAVRAGSAAPACLGALVAGRSSSRVAPRVRRSHDSHAAPRPASRRRSPHIARVPRTPARAADGRRRRRPDARPWPCTSPHPPTACRGLEADQTGARRDRRAIAAASPDAGSSAIDDHPAAVDRTSGATAPWTRSSLVRAEPIARARCRRAAARRTSPCDPHAGVRRHPSTTARPSAYEVEVQVHRPPGARLRRPGTPAGRTTPGYSTGQLGQWSR